MPLHGLLYWPENKALILQQRVETCLKTLNMP